MIKVYVQIPPVRGTFLLLTFTNGSKMNKLLFLELWHLFKYAEITEAVRHSDRTFVNVRNSVCLGTADENIENFLKARFVDPPDKNYSHNALHMYTKNVRTILRNQNVLKNLPREVYSIESNEKMMVVVIYIVNYRSANQSFFSWRLALNLY